MIKSREEAFTYDNTPTNTSAQHPQLQEHPAITSQQTATTSRRAVHILGFGLAGVASGDTMLLDNMNTSRAMMLQVANKKKDTLATRLVESKRSSQTRIASATKNLSPKRPRDRRHFWLRVWWHDVACEFTWPDRGAWGCERLQLTLGMQGLILQTGKHNTMPARGTTLVPWDVVASQQAFCILACNPVPCMQRQTTCTFSK